MDKVERSAAAALEQFPQFKPDILISDIAMPDGDEYELLQQLRTATQIPQGSRSDGMFSSRASLLPPAIALTAYSSATHEERSLQAGFQRHLTKPVDPEDLVATILSLVEGE